MEYGAIDLHTCQSQIRTVDENGGVLEDRRISTNRERLAAVFAVRPPMKVLVEASTEAEWVARFLESLGHQVIVADPNYTLMYATRSRHVITDRRDVAALAESCRLAIFRPVADTSPFASATESTRSSRPTANKNHQSRPSTPEDRKDPRSLWNIRDICSPRATSTATG